MNGPTSAPSSDPSSTRRRSARAAVLTGLASVAFAASMTAFVAGCGSSTPETEAAPDTTVVTTPTTLAPGTVLVRVGDGLVWDAPSYSVTSVNGNVTIRASNGSTIDHNLYVEAADGTRNPKHLTVISGFSTSDTFALAPGTYTLVCIVPGHEATMHSTLIVS